MIRDDNQVIIESRRGRREKPSARVAMLVSPEVEFRRLCRQVQVVPGSTRKIYHAHLLEVIHESRTVTMAGPFLGAPQAVLLLEKLIALGTRNIVVFGWCGSLQPELKIGALLLPTGARSEEGTSRHYPPGDYVADSDLAVRLQRYCEQRGCFSIPGQVWTTDAPLRETLGKVRSYGKEGVLAVDMEMSALFRVAACRKVQLAGLLVVSDELSSLKWIPGFRTSRFKDSCRQATRLLLDFCAALAADPGTRA